MADRKRFSILNKIHTYGFLFYPIFKYIFSHKIKRKITSKVHVLKLYYAFFYRLFHQEKPLADNFFFLDKAFSNRNLKNLFKSEHIKFETFSDFLRGKRMTSTNH